MRKIIYNIFKYPLILILLKTPVVNLLKKRFFKHRSLKSRGYFMFVIDTLFEREYLCKQENKKYVRELISSTVDFGEGEKWAKHYFVNSAQNLDSLKKSKVGSISDYENRPIFGEIINFIKIHKLSNDENTNIVQLGSSSGKDLEFFNNYFPKLNYISTDINDEILNFQKKKYDYKNFKYFKCFAEDIDKCLDHFNLTNKKLILFSIGSLQYVVPFYLKQFFSKVKNFRDLNLFICEPIKLSFIDNNTDCSQYRGKSSYSHNYKKYAFKFNTLEKRIIRPYENTEYHFKDTGTYYLHLANNKLKN